MEKSLTDISAETLNTLWNEGSREVTQAFLRRAVSSSMTLEELRQALEYRRVADHLGNLTLADVLPMKTSEHTHGSGQLSVQSQPGMQVGSLHTRRKEQRRKRKGPEQIEAIREEIMARLQSAGGGVNSTHLLMMLQKAGHDLDLLHLGRILNQLESDGVLSNLGGKPRNWRLKPQGRRAPEPIVIRKAAMPQNGVQAS